MWMTPRHDHVRPALLYEIRHSLNALLTRTFTTLINFSKRNRTTTKKMIGTQLLAIVLVASMCYKPHAHTITIQVNDNDESLASDGSSSSSTSSGASDANTPPTYELPADDNTDDSAAVVHRIIRVISGQPQNSPLQAHWIATEDLPSSVSSRTVVDDKNDPLPPTRAVAHDPFDREENDFVSQMRLQTRQEDAERKMQDQLKQEEIEKSLRQADVRTHRPVVVSQKRLYKDEFGNIFRFDPKGRRIYLH